MEHRALNQHLSIAPQLAPEDLPALRQAGFRAIICNRPDGESPDQPAFSEIEQEARRLGMKAHYLPTVPQNVTDEQAAAFGALLDELPKPVLGYCRTGRRAATLWALSQADKMPLSEILQTGAGAGMDLTELAPRITGK